jgi:cell division septum initiation protein DivIVA
LRGYDREAVDAHVERLSAVIEELQASRSPQAAVRRALDRVGEETAGILRQAEETAEQMTARSRAKADDRLQRAEAEARELRAAAEKHVRALDNDTERIWQERQRLIDDTRRLADTLLEVADSAEERFPPEPSASPTIPTLDEPLEEPSAPETPPEPRDAAGPLRPGSSGRGPEG